MLSLAVNESYFIRFAVFGQQESLRLILLLFALRTSRELLGECLLPARGRDSEIAPTVRGLAHIAIVY